MVKPMKYRDAARQLRAAGFKPHPGKGDHEKWVGPGGHHVTIPHKTELSPGVVKQVLSAIAKESAR
ncbi:MAG: type II toxin-antitoxin system HicA family toxin [Acidipropionibacterium sp.]|jgi:predicted RNA binding protein YcfA (HicA-like mRNA interferase family)|nr:type II toxin-antitoxin system HicA family toxin [Acidipropionibacterium sp.]